MAIKEQKIKKLETEAEELEEKLKEIEWKQREIVRQSTEKREEWNANPDNKDRPYIISYDLQIEYDNLDDEKKELDYKLAIVLATIHDLENPPEKAECFNCGRMVDELDEETDACKKCTREFEEGSLTPHVAESGETRDENKDPWDGDDEEKTEAEEPECSDCGEILETYEEKEVGICNQCMGEEETEEEDEESFEEEELECSDCGAALETNEEKKEGICIECVEGEEDEECSECGETLETEEEKEMGICKKCQKEYGD